MPFERKSVREILILSERDYNIHVKLTIEFQPQNVTYL